MGYRQKWTKSEDLIIKKNQNLRPKQITNLLSGRTWLGVRARLKYLKENNFKVDYEAVAHREYSAKEDKIIKDNLDKSTVELTKLLKNRSVVSIKKRRRDLGLKAEYRLPEFIKPWYQGKLNNNIGFKDFRYRYRTETNLNLQCINNPEHIFKKNLKLLILNYERSKTITCDYCESRDIFYKDTLEYKFPLLSKSFSLKNKKKASEVRYNERHVRYFFSCNKNHTESFLPKQLTYFQLKGKVKVNKDYDYNDICNACNQKTVFYNKSLMRHVCLSKNKIDILKKLSVGSSDEIWFQCKKYKDHQFKRVVYSAFNNLKKNEKLKCTICSNRTLKEDFNSIYAKLLKSTLFFDEKKNKKNPRKLIFTLKNDYWWGCAKCKTSFYDNTRNIFRHGRREPSCFYCNKERPSEIYSLKVEFPNLYKEIDKKLNKNIDIDNLLPNTHTKIWWRCTKNKSHLWKDSPLVRTKSEACPLCLRRWNKRYLKMFLESIIPALPTMTQSERWVFFQQSGILDSTKRNVAFAKQIASQKFPINEIEKFIEDEPSLVDDILDDPTITSDDYADTKTDVEIEQEVEQTIQKFDDVIEQTEENLPEIKSEDVLKSLDKITSSQFCDKEAIEFLIVSKKEKLWRDVFKRGEVAVKEIRKASGNEYVKRAKDEFLFEYDHTSKLERPNNFNARMPDGKLITPNLMQFLTTTRLNYNSRIGNWSGTGAGKTLSAILASRLLNLKFTIVTCPNSVVSNWENNIRTSFQDSEILDKRNLPEKINPKKHTYLVLNYEYFQQPASSKYVKKLLSLGKIAFIVIDEVHYTKQREIDNVSKRKEMIKNLVVEAGTKNKQLKVIGMSATPVINNLYEGRSMIELITGKEHKDIETKVNVNNCMYLFQKLSTIGTRYLPKYEVNINIKPPIEIDCSEVINEIKEKGSRNIKILELEQILTKVRIPEIIKNLEKKTIIYTHYISGIGEMLRDAIQEAGYTVGFYTGDNKVNRDNDFQGFIKGNIDVLIGTSAIGTGVDGLQNVCRKLIFNVLPWTNAEYEQIKGRIYRQGQKRDVEFIIPVTRAEVNGQEWSWCKTKLDRINYKKTVADASVDGIIPEEHLRSEHQVLQDLMKWLDRLSDKGVETFERKELASTLFTEDEKELRRRKINHGDFTKINKRWNSSRSGITHKRLQKDSSEWVHYHEEYRKARQDWTVTPYQEMIKFYKKRDGLIIGDFGCGEAFLHKELSSKHTIHSFDHIAMEKFVTECDFSNTPLEEESLDVAIYSLAMMGSNINEYLHEAHRVLRLDGKINIIEATKRFKDIEQFKVQLQEFGFDNVVSKGMWIFTHIVAEKSDRVIKKDAKIKF